MVLSGIFFLGGGGGVEWELSINLSEYPCGGEHGPCTETGWLATTFSCRMCTSNVVHVYYN